VRAWWKLRKRHFARESWVNVLDAGSFGNADAHALRDAIWPKEEGRDPKIINLRTGCWERGERMFNEAKHQLSQIDIENPRR